MRRCWPRCAVLLPPSSPAYACFFSMPVATPLLPLPIVDADFATPATPSHAAFRCFLLMPSCLLATASLSPFRCLMRFAAVSLPFFFFAHLMLRFRCYALRRFIFAPCRRCHAIFAAAVMLTLFSRSSLFHFIDTPLTPHAATPLMPLLIDVYAAACYLMFTRYRFRFFHACALRLPLRAATPLL